MTSKLLMMAAALTTLAACDSSGTKTDGKESAAATIAGGVKLRPGQWEMTSQMISEMPGMAEIPDELKAKMTAPKTFLTCITPEQASNPGGNVFSGKQQDADCSHDDLAVAGGRISGKITCKGGPAGKIVMAMDGRYSPESYEVTMKMSGDNPNIPAMETRGSARRVGECPATPPEPRVGKSGKGSE